MYKRQSYNIGIGQSTLNVLTKGYYDIAIGSYAGQLITTGAANTAIGAFALSKVTTAVSNTAIGPQTMQYITGAQNTFVGRGAAIGVNASSANSYNVGLGLSLIHISTRRIMSCKRMWAVPGQN